MLVDQNPLKLKLHLKKPSDANIGTIEEDLHEVDVSAIDMSKVFRTRRHRDPEPHVQQHSVSFSDVKAGSNSDPNLHLQKSNLTCNFCDAAVRSNGSGTG